MIEAVNGIPDLHLVVVGDGPERRALADAAAGRGVAATFCGVVPRAELALLLRAADYLVVYSAYEGLSHTLLEALAVGTPAIASRRGGNPEVIRDGVNGLLVPYPDAEALAAAVRFAFAPGVQQRLAAGAAADLDRFEWRGFVERTCTTLEGLAGGSIAGPAPRALDRRQPRSRP